MCIICNMTTHEGTYLAGAFLSEYRAAQVTMKAAVHRMDELTKHHVSDPALKKHYDKERRKLLRIMREWNKVEHTRERAT